MNTNRTQEVINQEYTNLSLQYGDKTFRHKILTHELQQLEQQMAQLLSEKPSEPVQELKAVEESVEN